MTTQKTVDCGSITRNIRAIQSGNSNGIRALFDRYFSEIAAAAKAFFGTTPRSVIDEEDIASAVIQKICNPLSLDGIDDREALLRLLMASARNKVRNVQRGRRAQKRGAGQVTLYSDLSDSLQSQFENLKSDVRSPQLKTLLDESISQLMAELASDFERDVFKMRLMGESIEAIASKWDTYPRKIDRKINLIRKTWSEINSQDNPETKDSPGEAGSKIRG